jgi:hypothetical protein
MDTPIIVAIISASVAIVTLIVTSIYRYQEINERKRTERISFLNERLNNFYGPLLSNLNVVKALYHIFRSDKPEGFRTLNYLLDPDQNYATSKGKVKVILSKTDITLLEEIIEVERKIEELIITQSGMVNDDNLMFEYIPNPKKTDIKNPGTSLMALEIAHFRLLRMAYDGNFRGETNRFKDFVYPREFDEEIKKQINLLQLELDDLLGKKNKNKHQ